jgi:hypothetical protein
MRRLFVLASLIALLAVPARALAADNVFLQVPGNPANRLATLTMDDYSYDYATRCRKHEQKGTLALQSWLQGHAGGVSWGIMRCEKFGKGNYSLHSEGRALDWHLDVHNGADRAEAVRLIDLWMAPDKNGNIHALARRMGIQELIWNCKAWFSGDGGLRPYSLCFDKHGKRRSVDDTSAHRNHIHIGLNWAGARMQSSFWQSTAARR